MFKRFFQAFLKKQGVLRGPSAAPKIRNKQLRSQEKRWLETMLLRDFLGRDALIDQINHASICREYTAYYLSLRFVRVQSAPAAMPVRVPVEMRVFRENEMPIQFLLHVVDGYVDEPEIFRADSSEISADLSFSPAQVQILPDPEVLLPQMKIKEAYGLNPTILEHPTSLIAWHNRMIEKTYAQLDAQDVFRMCRQDILADLALKRVVELFLENPFAGEYFDGELIGLLLAHSGRLPLAQSRQALLSCIEKAEASYRDFEWIYDGDAEKYANDLAALKQVLLRGETVHVCV